MLTEDTVATLRDIFLEVDFDEFLAGASASIWDTVDMRLVKLGQITFSVNKIYWIVARSISKNLSLLIKKFQCTSFNICYQDGWFFWWISL